MQPAVQQQLGADSAGQAAASVAVSATAAGNRILFLVVVTGADLDCLEEPRPSGPRYTRDSLRSLLQLLGCKPRLAYKIMLGVFQAVDQAVINARQNRISRKTFQVHPHRNGKLYVSLIRADFMQLVSTCAAQYSYKISPSSDELKVACSLRERRRCVVVLLCGTSGSGKSTLASILAGRLGITTVISTDSIRHMLRSFSSPEASPLLWASTYQAGQYVGAGRTGDAHASDSERTLAGYKAQCELLAAQLEQLVAGCEARQQSLICEGVHLNISCVLRLMSRHPDVLPFLVHIASADKHVERMAVRAKYMTLDPNKNRYVRYMGNIRLIQEYLVRKADKHAIPRVENTNVDRSVGIIHLTVMGCLRRMSKGESVLDYATDTTRMLAAEYATVLEHLEGEKERAAAAAAAAAAARASSLSATGGVSPGSAAVAGGAGPARCSNSSKVAAAAAADSVCRDTAKTSKVVPLQQQPQRHQPPEVQQAQCGLLAELASVSAHLMASNSVAATPAAAAAAAVVTCRSGAGHSSLETEQQRCEPTEQPHITDLQPTNASVQITAEPPPVAHASTPAPASSTPTTAACGGSSSSSTGGIAAALAGGVAVCRAVSPAPVEGDDLLLMSPEGPVLRWDKILQGSRLSPGDDHIVHSPVSPLAAAGLAMAYAQPKPGRGLNPFAAHTSAEEAAAAAAAVREPDTAIESDVEVAQSSGDNTAQPGGRRSSIEQQQQQEQELDFSSGEELDELGELGSSDNEHERDMLQEFGSMNESTTCDEHDEDDHELMGLRAWNAGMTRALWPSYHHVYTNPGTFYTGGASTTLPDRGTQTSSSFVGNCSSSGGARALQPDRSSSAVVQPGLSQAMLSTAGAGSLSASPLQQQQQQQCGHAPRALSAGATRQPQGWHAVAVESEPRPAVLSRPWSGGSSSGSAGRQHQRGVHARLRRSGSSGRVGSRHRWSGGGAAVSQQQQQQQMQEEEG